MRLITPFKYLFVALLVLSFSVMAGALIPRPIFSQSDDNTKDITIYLASNPIHTDIIIPADEASRLQFAFLADALPLSHPNVKWIMFGWGGRSFYLETPEWSQLKVRPVFRALTYDAAAMHVELLGEIHSDNDSLIPIHISKAELVTMKAKIFASFAKDAKDSPQLIEGASYGEFDQFYEANGIFNALIGCNTWTARMLRAAGVKTGQWNPFPQSLRFAINLHN